MIDFCLSSSSSTKSKSLPDGFEPHVNSVIIGRAKECKQASGNMRLRVIAQSYLPQYSNAINRTVKSSIVSEIVASIRESCPVGAFLKKSGNSWVEVNDAVAREKVGYTFRDLLSDKYRSSSKSKALKRRRDQAMSYVHKSGTCTASAAATRNSCESLSLMDCMIMAKRSNNITPMPQLSSSLFTLDDDFLPKNKDNQFDDVFDDENPIKSMTTTTYQHLPPVRRKSEIEWMDIMRLQLLE